MVTSQLCKQIQLSLTVWTLTVSYPSHTVMLCCVLAVLLHAEVYGKWEVYGLFMGSLWFAEVYEVYGLVCALHNDVLMESAKYKLSKLSRHTTHGFQSW